MSSPPTFGVKGLDWYGATTPVGVDGFSGEFSISWDSAEQIKAGNLVIGDIQIDQEMPAELAPTFKVYNDPVEARRLIVKFTIRIGGEFDQNAIILWG